MAIFCCGTSIALYPFMNAKTERVKIMTTGELMCQKCKKAIKSKASKVINKTFKMF
jgi:hypothetical protein